MLLDLKAAGERSGRNAGKNAARYRKSNAGVGFRHSANIRVLDQVRSASGAQVPFR